MLIALRIYSVLLFSVFYSIIVSAQTQEIHSIPSSSLEESYTNANKWYWKNNKPYADYWQQDVHYKIQATLDDSTQIVNGKEWLTYVNNSPDTLTEVYFHLYQNAFQPGSYHDDLYKYNNTESKYGKYEKQGLNTVVKQISLEEHYRQIPLQTKLNNTVLQVKLDKPLAPNQQIKFYVEFDTYFDNGGNVRRRMKTFTHNNTRHFDGVHWYPRIAVYDAKRRWDTDQHLNKELYGDFGSFDVELTLPSHYIAEATGNLVNENEVLPADLKQKLDIKNFASKKIGEKASVILAPDGKTKTWHYQSINVHDFAWTADPSYRISETYTKNGVHCVAICQEDNAAGWQTTPQLIAKIIETYSADFGEYTWPKIVVADARDGMEYNMLTLCGGVSPSYTSLLAHEIGHMWFYGILGSNETYRAMMDEGFTQFLTVWFMEKNQNKPISKNLRNSNYISPRDASLYYPYMRAAVDPTQLPLNTHSDQFYSQIGHGGGYGTVYYKTGTMLYNLQYVLGDSLFQAAMKNYYYKWMFKHPYPEDFRNSITAFVKTDLSWFFDEWIETNKTIDYKIEKVKKADSAYNITFKRIGGMQMPVDFTVELKSGKTQSYHIPNNWFIKKTDAQVLEPWIGWDKVRPTYTAHIKADEKIVNVWIDTTNRLTDINLQNNVYKQHIYPEYDNRFHNVTSRYRYKLFWRPDVWYNAVDGVKAGLHFNGNYFNREKFLRFTLWYNTALLPQHILPRQKILTDYVSFNFSYANLFSKTDNTFAWFTDLRALDGLYLGKIGITKTYKQNNVFRLDFKSMIRPNSRDLQYFLYLDLWQADKLNNTVNAKYTHTYSRQKSSGNISLALRSSALGSDYSYASVSPEINHNISLKKLILRNRIFATYISGNDIAPESQLYLSQANPEEMMDNKFVRSRAFVPENWLGFGNSVNHFQYGGGLNLRGYAGYAALVEKDSSVQATYRGNMGASYNAELDFSRIFKIKPKKILYSYFSLAPYMFFDAGIINTGSDFKNSPLRMDAGLGTALTIKNFGKMPKTSPLTLRFDMPFYLSDRPYLDNNNFAFRWIVGVGRAF